MRAPIGSECSRSVSPEVLNGITPTYGVTIISFQFAENNGGQDSQSAEAEERVVKAVNHFGRAGVMPVGNEERSGQRRCRNAEA